MNDVCLLAESRFRTDSISLFTHPINLFIHNFRRFMIIMSEKGQERCTLGGAEKQFDQIASESDRKTLSEGYE